MKALNEGVAAGVAECSPGNTYVACTPITNPNNAHVQLTVFAKDDDFTGFAGIAGFATGGFTIKYTGAEVVRVGWVLVS